MLTEDNADWLNSYIKKHGRAPRVLHIGNIANNAYNNARLLNEVGLECDVICYDYYHIMGCPEWEDADFEGEIKDDFYPDWSSVDLNGFERPKWFAQGPLNICIKYLIARRSNYRIKSFIWWKMLEMSRWMICSSFVDRFRKKIISIRDLNIRTHHHVVQALFYLLLMLRRSKALCFTLIGLIPMLSRVVLRFCCKALPGSHKFISRENVTYSFDENVSMLVETFRHMFPDREDKLTKNDLELYRSTAPVWKALFEKYDIIEAYSTDAIYPLITDKRPYVAYEHGTIRDIPFERTGRGRTTLLSYALADSVYMTNADSVYKAKTIIADESKLQFGLHGFDNRRIENKIHKLNSLSIESGRFGIDQKIKLFFCPARHHWLNGFPTWLKGNNIIIEAVKRLEKQYEGKFQVVFVEWGQEVELSKNLIKEWGLDKFFLWITPLGKYDLLNAYRCADCVMDQFVLPCIGGITIEALTVGKAPIITYLDDNIMRDFYTETIPCFNCRTAEEVATSMEMVISDCSKDILDNCRKWMGTYHTYANVINSNIEAYRKAGVS